ncbi:MAG: hypothetical protein ACR65U_04275 [Methylocystis sp.]
MFDIAVEPFRRSPKARPPQNGELHFQLLDQQRFGVNFRGERRREATQFSGIFRQISNMVLSITKYVSTQLDNTRIL